MIVLPATLDDILYVADHLRPHSWREVFLQRPIGFTPTALAAEMRNFTPNALVQVSLGPSESAPPAAIFTAYKNGATGAVFRILSTEAWPAIAGAYPRWMLREVGPVLRAAGCTFAEFSILADPEPNWRWFALMGARPNGDPLPRGRNGEPYQPMVVIDAPPAALSSAQRASNGGA